MAITKSETSYILSLDIPSEIKGSDRKELLADLAEYLLTEVVIQVEAGASPVEGQGDFKKLSKPYANSQKGGDDNANLDLNGDMLAALTSSVIGNNKIKIGIKGEQAIKSYAHNTGFKGHKTIKGKDLRRAFIPDVRQKEKFDKSIMSGLQELIDEKLSEVTDG